jgi:hypothetical protein
LRHRRIVTGKELQLVAEVLVEDLLSIPSYRPAWHRGTEGLSLLAEGLLLHVRLAEARVSG